MQLYAFPIAASLLSLSFALNQQSAAQTVTLAPSADTSIFEFAFLNNLGAMLSLAAGETASHGPARALMKFNITNAVPAGAVIVGARVRVNVVKTPFLGEPSTFGLYRVLANWTEGNKGAATSTGTGAVASPGETTWQARMHPTTLWAEPGLQAGTDRSAVASGLVAIAGNGSYTFNSTTQLVADVQSWLDQPASNFGWLLKSESEGLSATARRFGSREDSANAPRLEITFTIPVPLEVAAQRQDRELRLTFLAQAGFTYTVEHRDSVAAGAWTPLTNITTKLEDIEAVAIDSLDAAGQRFYRLSRMPCECD